MTLFVIIVCLSWGILSVSSYVYSVADFKRIQNYHDIFSELNTQTNKDCVVLVKEQKEELERLIPAYTHCNVYSTNYIFVGITPPRIVHNFFIRMRLDGVDAAHVHDYLINNEAAIRLNFFSDWGQLFAHGQDQWVNGKIRDLEKKYVLFLTVPLKDEVLKYQMDYIATDLPLSQVVIGQLPGLSLRKIISGYYLYSLIALGEIADKQGNKAEARKYFKDVKSKAGRKDEAFKDAKRRLKDLEKKDD